MNFLKRFSLRAGAIGFVMQALALRVYASPAGQNIPWEKPMQLIAQSLSGPVAYGIALIGIALAGGMLIFGHELGEVGRRACMLALVVAVLIGAVPMLTQAFGMGASVI